MKILLTGATGYIGQHMFKRLCADHDVFITTRKTTASITNRFEQAAGICEWDLGLGTNIPDTFPHSLDGIIHMAQSKFYRTFPEDALDVVNVNVTATAKLLDYASRSGVKQFCHISSGSVYEPYSGTLDETQALTPSSINGSTKAAAEMLVLAYKNVFHVSSHRLFMPYGPGQTERLLQNLIDRVYSGTPVDLAEGIGLTMAPLYIDDTVNIIAQSIEEAWSGTFNLAGRETLTLRAIVNMIAEELDKELIINETDGQAVSLVPPVDRLAKIYDMSTLTPFTDGLRATIDQHDF